MKRTSKSPPNKTSLLVKEKETKKKIFSFLERLYSQYMEPQNFSEFFFTSPLSLFSQIQKIPFLKLELDLENFLKQNKGHFKELSVQLKFLDQYPKILSKFQKRKTDLIYSGLAIYLLCIMYDCEAKIYRFHDSKTIVSCDLGFKKKNLVRIGLFVLDGGFAFCPLSKMKKRSTKNVFKKRIKEKLNKYLKLQAELPSVIKISKSDLEHLQLFNQNLGLYSQLFIDTQQILRKKFEFEIGSKELQTRLLKLSQLKNSESLINDSSQKEMSALPIQSLKLTFQSSETFSKNSFLQSISLISSQKNNLKKTHNIKNHRIDKKSRKKRKKKSRIKDEINNEEGNLKKEFLKKFGLEFDSQVDKRIFVNYSDLSEYLDLINIKLDYLSRFELNSKKKINSNKLMKNNEFKISQTQCTQIKKNSNSFKQEKANLSKLVKNQSFSVNSQISLNDSLQTENKKSFQTKNENSQELNGLDEINEEPNRWKALGSLRSPRSTFTREESSEIPKIYPMNFQEIISSDEDFAIQQFLPKLDRNRSNSFTERADLERLISGKRQSQPFLEKILEPEKQENNKIQFKEDITNIETENITTVGKEILSKNKIFFNNIVETKSNDSRRFSNKNNIDLIKKNSDVQLIKGNLMETPIVENIAYSLAGKSLQRMKSGVTSQISKGQENESNLQSRQSIMKQEIWKNKDLGFIPKIRRAGTASTNTHASSKHQTQSKQNFNKNIFSSNTLTQDGFSHYKESFDLFADSSEHLPEKTQIGSFSKIENTERPARKRFSEVVRYNPKQNLKENNKFPPVKVSSKYSQESIKELEECESSSLEIGQVSLRPKRSIFCKLNQIKMNSNETQESEVDPMDYVLNSSNIPIHSEQIKSKEELIDFNHLNRICEEIQDSDRSRKSSKSNSNITKTKNRESNMTNDSSYWFNTYAQTSHDDIETASLSKLPFEGYNQFSNEEDDDSRLKSNTEIQDSPNLSEPRLKISVSSSHSRIANLKNNFGNPSSNNSELNIKFSQFENPQNEKKILKKFLTPVINSENQSNRQALVEKKPIQVNSLKKSKLKKPLKLTNKKFQSYKPKMSHPLKMTPNQELNVTNEKSKPVLNTAKSWNGQMLKNKSVMPFSNQSLPPNQNKTELGIQRSFEQPMNFQNHYNNSQNSMRPVNLMANELNQQNSRPNHLLPPKANLRLPGFTQSNSIGNVVPSQNVGMLNSQSHPTYNSMSPYPSQQTQMTQNSQTRNQTPQLYQSVNNNQHVLPGRNQQYHSGYGYKPFPPQQMIPGYNQSHYIPGGFNPHMIHPSYYPGYSIPNLQGMPYPIQPIQRSFSNQIPRNFQNGHENQRFPLQNNFAQHSLNDSADDKNNSNNGLKRFTGRLKFYNPGQEFGFIIKKTTLEDIFFHLSDMEGAGITAQQLQENKNLYFSFEELDYMGKKGKSKKAINISVKEA